MPGLNTGNVQYAAQLPLSLSRYIEQQLRRPPDFSQVQRAYQQQYNHPSLQLGPGGGFLDPQQMQRNYSTNYLGERGGIAMSDLQNKMQLAGQLTSAGGNYAQLINSIPFLQAQNLNNSTSSGVFGSLGF